MIGPVVISVARLILIGTTAGILAWIGCFVLWVRCAPPEIGRWLDKVVRAGTVTIVVVVALVSLALDGIMALLETSYAFQPIHVLSPASPGGCRLVLWQEPDSNYGQNTYGFLKVPGSVKLRNIPGVVWLNPDNSSVHWRLTWTDGRAHLTGWGTDHPKQTWDSLVTPVVCPAR